MLSMGTKPSHEYLGQDAAVPKNLLPLSLTQYSYKKYTGSSTASISSLAVYNIVYMHSSPLLRIPFYHVNRGIGRIVHIVTQSCELQSPTRSHWFVHPK